MTKRTPLRAAAHAALITGMTVLLTGASPAAAPLATQAGASSQASSALEEPVFESAFEHFDNLPEGVAVPAHAVNIETFDPPVEERASTRAIGGGLASYYGRKFNGRRTASGERFDMTALTAAHKTLPFGTRVKVTNTRTGKSVVVKINDRGPFVRGRVIDVSRAAAERIGLISSGHAPVELEVIG
jgi:rare lipoprotein A